MWKLHVEKVFVKRGPLSPEMELGARALALDPRLSPASCGALKAFSEWDEGSVGEGRGGECTRAGARGSARERRGARERRPRLVWSATPRAAAHPRI